MTTRPFSRRTLAAAATATGAALALGWRALAHEDHGDGDATPVASPATPAATPGTPVATPLADHIDHADPADPADHHAMAVDDSGVGGAYLAVANLGPTADALLGGRSDVCQRVEPHAMRMVGDVMTMTLEPAGIPLPPGETVTLDPGGDAWHLMLVGLTRDLLPGESFTLTLTFRDAGEIPVTVAIGWARPEATGAPDVVGNLSISAVWSRPAPALVG